MVYLNLFVYVLMIDLVTNTSHIFNEEILLNDFSKMVFAPLGK